MLVNWLIISPHLEVLFSSLEIPNVCNEFDTDVAVLIFEVGAKKYGIDIAWFDEEKKFVVRLFQESYHYKLSEVEVSTSSEVVDQVVKWVKEKRKKKRKKI